MNYNPTPKSEFIKSPDRIAEHRSIVQNESLRRGVEVAMAELQRRLADASPPEMGPCAAAHLRALGAHDFVEVFMNLAETGEREAKQPSMNLPGNVRPMKGGN